MSTFTTQVAIASVNEFGKDDLYKAITNARLENNLNNEFVGHDILHSYVHDRSYIELVFMSNHSQNHTYFVTFGEDHRDIDGESLFGKYYVVTGFNEEHARGKIQALRKTHYCAMYPITRLKDMIENYGMTEVPADHIFVI